MSYWAHSHVGLRRTNNEDALLTNPEIGLFGVADGMGGHASGEVASAEAVRIISQSLSPCHDLIARFTNPTDHESRGTLWQILLQAMEAANQSIHELALTSPGGRMGTTFCGGLINDRQALIANVGDSRAYMTRNGQLYQLTQDHTVIGEQLRRGMITEEQAATSPHRHILLKALGVEAIVDADIVPVELCLGDRLLFCSDGVHGQLGWQELAELMTDDDGERSVVQMIEAANRAGGKDNATAVLIAIDGSRLTNAADQDYDHLVDPQAKIHALWQLPLFKTLDYAELMKLMAVCHTKIWRAGELVYAEHEHGDEFAVILEGELAVVSGGQQLALVGPGQHVGELSLIDGAPRSATVLANVETKALLIKRDDFYALLRRELSLSNKLLWQFSARMATLIRDLTNQVRTRASSVSD